MAQGQLMGSAVSAFNSAGAIEEGISERAMKERVAADDRRSKQSTELLSTGIQQYGANKRQQVSEEGANQRQQTELDAQFITLTPQMKKGAAEVTEDPSWNDIPDGYKMRADVYSSLLSVGTEMKRINKPQTLEIQEGDQVYTAEYDPKTRQLRKLTSGGNRFSPDSRDGKKGGAQLNPFTLQNIVRQDEKTLLAQLGGKGKKGIPSAGGVDKLLSKISGGRIQELNTEEKAKLATLRALAQRMKNNYQNLADLEVERGLQPTVLDPEVSAVIDQLVGSGREQEQTPKPEGASGTKVQMKGPDGKTYMIPSANVQKAMERGFTK